MLTDAVFLLAVAIAVFILLRAFAVAFGGRARVAAWLALGAWLALSGALAAAGVLAPSPHRPPPNLIVAMVGIVALCVLALAAPGRRLAGRVHAKWVVGMQAFRIPVELFLWLASTAGIAPVLMSWHGRNFDMISGVLALALGLTMILTRRPLPRAVLVAFHVVGLGLVLNVVVHAVLALPGPLQRIYGQEPLFVTTFPYVWLPALLVPLAIAGHLFGLRQVFSQKTARPALTPDARGTADSVSA